MVMREYRSTQPYLSGNFDRMFLRCFPIKNSSPEVSGQAVIQTAEQSIGTRHATIFKRKLS